MASVQNRLVRLFERHFGAPPRAVLELAGDGSSRSYWRMVGPGMETAVGALGPDAEENEAFFAFTRAFRGIGLPVPELYGVDPEAGVWLEQDLGDTTLFDALVAARDRERTAFPDSVLELYRRVVEVLPRFQVEGARVVDFDVCYPRSAFDRQSMEWDLNYFKYHFLKLAHVPFNEARLERDFRALVDYLVEVPADGFLYRDFQSRNILIRDGGPWFVDYQGGRRGAPHYDVASLLYDAKADMPRPARAAILDHYLAALAEHRDVDGDAFRERLRGFVLIRVMQAMGAYGYRGFFERKPRFLQSVPYAARNLGEILDDGLPLALPELERAFRGIVEDWARDADDAGPGHDGLTVRVSSFSYRGGYPEDRGGHGGGYVFDCRALPNPGRQIEYREMSGLDDEVVRYLTQAPEVEAFWKGVRDLVEAQIQEYLRRSFTHLSVSFGCTGGQHRSVYFAERLARHVRGHHPEVLVDVEHRERKSWPRRVTRQTRGGVERDEAVDAMILAAGLGTRLRPLTDDVPKALVRVGERTMLERVAERLVAAGADRLIVNVHHHAERVVEFLDAWERRRGREAGVEVRVSREAPEVLETGGGLKHARPHFRREAPFFLHNVDVVSTVDLERLYRAHRATSPLATLAVSDRDTSRPLLFDERGLYGHGGRDGTVHEARPPVGRTRAVGFSGIHVLDPRILDLLDEEGVFSIIPVYMRLVSAGERILPWDMGDALWVDVGTHERLARAREIVEAEEG